MGQFSGTSSAEIDAPIADIWAVIADVESSPKWQHGLVEVNALEKDSEGRAVLAKTVGDAKVRQITATVRFDYSQAPTRLSWKQLQGDLKSLSGRWDLEDLGGGRTRATYSIEVDTGRMIGMLVRGGVEERVRAHLVDGRPGELKAHLAELRS